MGRKSLLQREVGASHRSRGKLKLRVLEAKRVDVKDSLIAAGAAGKHPLGFPPWKLLEKSWGKASSVGWCGLSLMTGVEEFSGM